MEGTGALEGASFPVPSPLWDLNVKQDDVIGSCEPWVLLEHLVPGPSCCPLP